MLEDKKGREVVEDAVTRTGDTTRPGSPEVTQFRIVVVDRGATRPESLEPVQVYVQMDAC